MVLSSLLNRLWQAYIERVEYARKYAELVQAKGGRVVNDHIAFRTLNVDGAGQPAGIPAIARVIEPLGYHQAGQYEFKDKHLNANHYEHDDLALPKIFISQLEVDQLPGSEADLIRQAVASGKELLSKESIDQLSKSNLSTAAATALCNQLSSFFMTRPWGPPSIEMIHTVNAVSQYGAWTLLHGNNVNHFTAYINEQAVSDWPDIDATVAGLTRAGIPMKPEVEGRPGSKLRQTATQAVNVDCDVVDEAGKPAKLKWAYAYYELAERGDVAGPDGKPMRFQGFLGSQATQLFDMTKR
jgi:hypothetical protein